MLYAYLDESYMQGQVYLMGALILTPQQVQRLNSSLDGVIWSTHKAHPGISMTSELHGQALFQRSGDWVGLRAIPSAAFAIYRRSVSQIVQSGGVYMVRGVRRPDRIAERYPFNPWPPHQIALQYLLEEIHRYAKGKNEQVTLIADQVPDQDHHESRMQAFQLKGQTPGYRSESLDSIAFPMQWVDSREHRALQAADLLTFAYLRKWFAQGSHPRPARELDRIYDLFEQMIAASGMWTP